MGLGVSLLHAGMKGDACRQRLTAGLAVGFKHEMIGVTVY